MTPARVDPTALWLLVTIAAYWFGTWCYERGGRNALLNPWIIALVIVLLVLLATGTPYAAYADGVAFLNWLMGPAVVAIAVPLYQSLRQIRATLAPALVVVGVGAVTSVVAGAGLAALAGADRALVAAMAPKSVTTPVALQIAERVGGIEALTAVFVALTGIVGVLTSTGVCRLLKVTDHRAQGLVLGVTAHLLGVARGFSLSREMGTFAAVGMGVGALLVALVLPLVLALLG
jgi:putative effector of murein hydrolase